MTGTKKLGFNGPECRAILARLGIPHFALAAAVRVSPAKLSALLNGRLDEAEADRLRGEIEVALGLEGGSLAGSAASTGCVPTHPLLIQPARTGLGA